MRIAVDAMGGDYAPDEIVKGVIEAAASFDGTIILVGNESIIRGLLSKYNARNDKIEICHASEVVDMSEHPASAVRKKRDSSIVKANILVKEGKADAVVSAGSTGAAMTASLLYLGRIKGIDRPGIVGVLPNVSGRTVLVDVGANVDCKASNLLQFAVMGNIYAKNIMGLANPRIGLLSNGTEETKGNELVLETHQLLKQLAINYIGNVEGRDVFNGTADVIICDGFVGNVLLKTAEGLSGSLIGMLKEEIDSSLLMKLGAGLMLYKIKDLKKRIDYAEYGGAPLLGVNGVSIISHGSSKATAVKNAVKAAAEAVDQNLIESIKQNIETQFG